jgi:RNA polymerase sigma-70 factor, ECF subfamily
VDERRQEAYWVLLAQVGDREALELLLRGVRPALHRYLTRLAGPALAEDLTQEVLLTICRKLGALREPELFRAWMYRIASRAAMRQLSKEKRWPKEDAVVLEEMAAEETRIDAEILESLATMDGISAASRAVMILHFQEELPLAEVAAILGIPVGTAKSRLAYGLAALRKKLAK